MGRISQPFKFQTDEYAPHARPQVISITEVDKTNVIALTFSLYMGKLHH